MFQPSLPGPNRDSNSTFKLLPATKEDIPSLTHIHLVTLADDPPAQIKFPNSSKCAEAVSSMLEGQIGDSKWYVMKAVDEESGEIGSWASWLTHSSSDDDGEKKYGNEGNEEKEQEIQDEGKFTFQPGLGVYVMDNTNNTYASWSKTHSQSQYLSLRACFTLKEFERRGMATALVTFGAKRADEMGLHTLVQASPSGKRIYEKVGFQVFDYLDVEMGDERWVAGQGEVDDKFRRAGVYRFSYLDRKPEVR